MHKNLRFAPIYDSGSSLMRECTEEKVSNMLTDNIQFEAYLNRGVTEIHWQGNKIPHLSLLQNLKQTNHWEIIQPQIEQVVKKYKESDFKRFLDKIDTKLPPNYSIFKLSENRKALILKSVSLRVHKFYELV